MLLKMQLFGTIESIEISDVPQTLGIVDNSSSLFIKFEVIDKSVEVLLIEPYIST